MAKQATMKNAALKQLTKDADEILHLIKVQLDNLTLPSCPLYERIRYTNVWTSKRS